MWDWSFGAGHDGARGMLPLGPEYLLNADGQLSPVTGSHGGGTGGGGVVTASDTISPASTLVGSSTGLQIDLIWDASVQSNANWQAIEQAVITAAQFYTNTFSNHVVLNIDVGFGEIAGSALSANALGESESYGYITSYKTVENYLTSADSALIHSGVMASNAIQALANLRGESFFVTSAEAKAIGLVGASTSVDGYIGLTSGSLLFFGTPGQTVPSGQYDAVGVAAHEISEVMGRLGMEGATLGTYRNVYTPLDIFRYSSAGHPDTHPTAGYFSLNDGKTNLGTYNNPANGGDASDWASLSTNTRDSYDAFDNPGVTTQVTATDLLEVAALGYQVAPGVTLTTQTA
jgi:hypothetical protein